MASPWRLKLTERHSRLKVQKRNKSGRQEMEGASRVQASGQGAGLQNLQFPHQSPLPWRSPLPQSLHLLGALQPSPC